MEIYFEDEDLEELIFTGMNRKYKKYSRDRKFMENLIDVLQLYPGGCGYKGFIGL